MRKYINKYRMDMERDYYTDDPILEGDTWIRVDSIMRKRGGKVYRYDENVLVAYIPSSQKGNNILKFMAKNSIEVVRTMDYSDGWDIHFLESDLENMESILGLSTFGASIVPESIKNHKYKDQIRQEKRENRSEEEKERFRLLGEKLRESRENK